MEAPPGGPAVTNSTLSWTLDRGSGGRTVGTNIYVGCAEARGAPGGELLRFVNDDLTIGRSPPPGVPAFRIDDRRISGEHARIGHQGGAFHLSDLGSRNGTLLDGRPVDEPVRLRDGALLFLAGHAALFRLLD